MILIVDDDVVILRVIKEMLLSEDYKIEAFTSAKEALKAASALEPDLVISDIMMPEMDGFQFKRAYMERFPDRLTPFLFLSTLSDTESMVRGLELGVNDYLTKPIPPELLIAKIRSHLKLKRRYASPTFHGDLAKFPFYKIMQFCESKGFTGDVLLLSGEKQNTVTFVKGEISNTESIADFDHLFDLTEGLFIIHSRPLEFKDIAKVAVAPPAETPVFAVSEDEKPMGKLSGVKVKDRMFQVQTEFVSYPDKLIQTIVILDGKVVKRHNSTSLKDFNKEALEKAIEEQHLFVEKEVKEKIHAVIEKKSEQKEPPLEKANRLFDMGFEKYKEKDYEGAISIWDEALSLNPSDRLLEYNIKTAKKKLDELKEV